MARNVRMEIEAIEREMREGGVNIKNSYANPNTSPNTIPIPSSSPNSDANSNSLKETVSNDYIMANIARIKALSEANPNVDPSTFNPTSISTPITSTSPNPVITAIKPTIIAMDPVSTEVRATEVVPESTEDQAAAQEKFAKLLKATIDKQSEIEINEGVLPNPDP
jgi:hypothetical protein